MIPMRRRLAGVVAWAAMALIPLQNSSALDIQFDYRFDTSGFFSGPHLSRRAVLEAAALVFEERILDRFSAITPEGANTWSLIFQDPSSGNMVEIKDPVLPADTIVVYVGARELPGEQLGYASFGYSWEGYAPWANLFGERDSDSNFDAIGGSLSFDASAPWYFDSDVATWEDFEGRQDFYTVVLHELGHLLGFGSSAFTRNRVGNQFVGPEVLALYGGPAPLDPGSSHFQEGTKYLGQETAMDPTQISNSRKVFTELDWAVFKDIGYDIKNAAAVPLRLTSIKRSGDRVTLNWTGGTGPYQAQVRSAEGNWSNIGPATNENTVTLTSTEFMALFRIAGR